MNKKPARLSVVIITHNEINNIEALINNITFADEIIIVDSFSDDGTWEYLQGQSHIKRMQHAFVDFADQRNYAMRQASMDWILFIDADERLPETLIREIETTINLPNNYVAYKIPRIFKFKDKTLKYCGLQSDKILRLFKQGKAYYDPSIKVHEELKVNGPIANLKNSMLHYSFQDYHSYKAKTEHYAELKAKSLHAEGKQATFWERYIKPIYKFLYNYIIRLGFLDGKEGFTLCKLNAYGVKYRYQVLDQLSFGSPKK